MSTTTDAARPSPSGQDAPQAGAAPRRNARTEALLRAPLLPTLLRMAAPNVAVMLAQASTGLVETAFIGRLGLPALTGVAVVFPVFMLMQMMSGGAMGGAISAAVARALGAGRTDEAEVLAAHAVGLNLLIGLGFAAAGLLGGPALYRAVGAEGEALDAALRYSHVLFAGAPVIWLFNGLASCIRGTGNMAVPATVTVGGAALLVPLSPCLIFGLGPLPAMGVAGGAAAMLGYYAGGAVLLALFLRRPGGVLRLRRALLRPAAAWAIARVGLLASLSSLQTQLVVTFTTAFLAPFGPGAIAGYGTGARLEYLLIPLVFGLGAPLVAIVGTNLGAGQRERALRAAWTGAALAFAMTEGIGLLAAAFPDAWLGLFGTDPGMREAGALFLRTVGPFFGLFGLGMSLYFASQGAGRVAWPVVAAVARAVVAVGGGAVALRAGAGLGGVFAALAAGMVLMAAINAAAVAKGAWFVGKETGR